MAALVLASMAAGAIACGAPTLDNFEKNRDADLAQITQHRGADRAALIRERILRDGAAAKWPVSLGVEQAAQGKDIDPKYVYLWAPVRERVGQDYVMLGDALREVGDDDGAIGAYEAAIDMAEAFMLGPEGAAKVRVAALRGEEALWAARKDAARAAVARAMAASQEQWLRGPEAEEERRKYNKLLSESHESLQKHLDEQTAKALEQMGSAMLQMQQGLAAAQRGAVPAMQAAATAQMSQQFTLLAQKTATDVLTLVSSSSSNDVTRSMRDLMKGTPALLAAIDSGRMSAIAKTDEGKVILASTYKSLVGFRRGQRFDRVASDLAKLAAVAAPAPAESPPPAPAQPPTKEAVEVRLKRLEDLREKKAITDEEYQRERARVLKEGL